jgi:serine/threonine protein kinase
MIARVKSTRGATMGVQVRRERREGAEVSRPQSRVTLGCYTRAAGGGKVRDRPSDWFEAGSPCMVGQIAVPSMPVLVSDATLPPTRGSRLTCPRCHREPESFPGYMPQSGVVARCPDHGLAFVDAYALAEAGDDPLLGATFANRFTILSRLGRGSMGYVYRARQEAVGRDVALKIMRRDRAYDAEAKARFEREARAVSSLASPHSVTAFDFGEAEDGSWFLVMEMLEGETLGERLKRTGRLNWREATRFVRHALLSLAEAHQKGIIHRDLKPDNLFLTKPVASTSREICKVLDFGIAKWMGSENGPLDALETQAGTVFGTPRYMSPEQAQGAPLDARSDLYSLGVLFYHMLAGRAPFADDDAVVVMARHIKDTPPPLSEIAPGVEIPPSLERVLRRALEKDPSERPQSAEAFIAMIDVAVEEAGSAASGVHLTSLPPPRATSKSPRVWVALLAVALFAIASVAIVVLRASSKVEPPVPAVEPIAAEPIPESERSPVAAVATSPTSTAIENSAAALAVSVAAPAVSASGEPVGSARPKRNVGKRAPLPATPKLERKGNERYGRFD